MSERRRFLLQVREITRRLYDDVSLLTSARLGGRSSFEFHRMFRRLGGETPKQYTLRVRLERAAGELMAIDKARRGELEGLRESRGRVLTPSCAQRGGRAGAFTLARSVARAPLRMFRSAWLPSWHAYSNIP